MLYHRRKILLALLETFEGVMLSTTLQKLLFLFTRQQTEKSYDFVPYRFGCFSFQANQDMLTMAKLGFLDIEESEKGKQIKLIKKESYCQMLNIFEQQELQALKSQFITMSQDDLIRYTYQKYPYWATKSTIAKKLMNDIELAQIEKQKRTFTEMQLFSIGYEGISLEKYLNKLIINDVKVLCDVRKNAYSQKYGFSKSQLSTACEGIGIEYIHIPNLGIQSDQRQTLNSQSDYDLLFERYENTTLIQNNEALVLLENIIQQNKRVAITCFEANPLQCHRTRIANTLTKRNSIFNCKTL